jgi:hypothetical protein
MAQLDRAFSDGERITPVPTCRWNARVACQVRYLSSAGIQPAEVRGVQALADALPEHWLLFASMVCYPRKEHPLDIDVLLAMDDRVLLIELKDWRGDITSAGDIWYLDVKRRMGRSPVALLSEKARKVKGILGARIPPLARTSLDFRVVITGGATFETLSDDDRRYTWTLPQACSIGSKVRRDALLDRPILPQTKPCMLVKDFERVLGDPKMFQPRKPEWNGYVAEETNTFVHPRGIWSENRAHQLRDPRMKALLRLWDFDKLPVGLNTLPTRELVADRERRVVAHLKAADSWLADRTSVLSPVGSPEPEILTHHHELFAIPNAWTSLRRYLEQQRDALTDEQRADLAVSLLNLVSELHLQGVAHRDLAPPCVWVGSPTRLAVTGFMSAQVEHDESVGEWLSTLRGYGPDLPEDRQGAPTGTGKQRDVYALGALLREVFASQDGQNETPADELEAFLSKAMAGNPAERFTDAVEMAEAFASVSAGAALAPDPSRLDGFESANVPMAVWPPLASGPQQSGGKLVWESAGADGRYRVKLWPAARRGLSAAADMTLLAMLEGAARLRSSPAPGLATIEDAGLALMGAYLVTRWVDGIGLETWTPVGARDLASCVEQLCLAVAGLHDLGLSHADLCPRNIVVSPGPTPTITIVDLFDLPLTATGRVRNLAYAPSNWEVLTDRQIDNFAVAKIARELTGRAQADPCLETLRSLCDAELERSAVETLDPLLDTARAVLRAAERPAPETLVVAAPRTPPAVLQTPEGVLWVSRKAVPHGQARYAVSSLDKRLSFATTADGVENLRLESLAFDDLAVEQSCAVTSLRLEVRPAGRPQGFSALAERISASAERGPSASSAPTNLNLGDLWARMIDVEEDLAPQVVIKGRPASALERRGAYVYEAEAPFDFDGESEVEVRTLVKGRPKRIGTLDLDALTETELVLRNQVRALEPGEAVTLVDKRARVSLDRRRRAVNRILRRESPIPDLIEYFETDRRREGRSFDLNSNDKALATYELNEGQREAFHKIVTTGPIGLLQGPPGTGKTRFIAALTHWLVTKGGARKVLLTSQSNEAVNGAAEEVIKTFRAQGDRLDLLRIGARGLTDRLRPYHTTSLREAFEQRFVASRKARLSAAGAAVGIPRALVSDLIDLDRGLGVPARRIERLGRLSDDADLEPIERRRLRDRERAERRAWASEARSWLGRDIDPDTEVFDGLIAEAQIALLARHPNASPADVTAALRILQLGDEWVNTLRSGHRNFDEFLAKTRTVVAGTCVGLGQTRVRLEATSFDWVIVDEAARCTSSELAVPLQLGRRVLLVGDHLQLPPTLTHELERALAAELPELPKAERRRSDFERIFTSHYGRTVGQVLTEQYRMPDRISRLVSRCFYEPRGVELTRSPERKGDERFLEELPPVLRQEVLWLDTSGMPGAIEIQQRRQRETWNRAEVDVILRTLQQISVDAAFVSRFAKDEDPAIGVICMYKLQKHRLEQAFAERPFPDTFRRMVKIDTVDAYQGKQNRIVIVSLVRNNSEFIPGHVSRAHRCNVAFSRAQERLIIVGAREMWGHRRCRSPVHKVLELIVEGAGEPPLGSVRPAGDLV